MSWICIYISVSLTAFKDYIVQSNKFQIIEEYGCANVTGPFGLTFLLLDSMQLLFPLTSLTLYARECLPGMLLHTLDTFPTARLIMTYFRRNQDLDVTLESNTSHTTIESLRTCGRVAHSVGA